MAERGDRVVGGEAGGVYRVLVAGGGFRDTADADADDSAGRGDPGVDLPVREERAGGDSTVQEFVRGEAGEQGYPAADGAGVRGGPDEGTVGVRGR